MFKLSVSTTFDAAHRLENYNGACARLHGHTFTVTGEWEKGTLDNIGMALDLVELKRQLRVVVADMDHNFLNKVRALTRPTAENIARLLFKRLRQRTPQGEFLSAVIVEETHGCSVRYTEDRPTGHGLYSTRKAPLEDVVPPQKVTDIEAKTDAEADADAEVDKATVEANVNEGQEPVEPETTEDAHQAAVDGGPTHERE